MQDYSRLYPSRIRVFRQASKLHQIRKLLFSGLPPEVMLLLIAAVVLPKEILEAIRK